MSHRVIFVLTGIYRYAFEVKETPNNKTTKSKTTRLKNPESPGRYLSTARNAAVRDFGGGCLSEAAAAAGGF